MTVHTQGGEFGALRARLAQARTPAGARAAAKTGRPAGKPTGPPPVPPPPDLSAAVAVLPGAGRSWTLLMPHGDLLTSNQRLHYMAAHRLTKRMRNDAAHAARARRLPRLRRAAVFYVLHPRPVRRRRDPGNWAPSAKAYVDGLVDAGVLADDDAGHLTGPCPMLGDPVPGGAARMSLVVVELGPGL
ncbi:hypothetical protein [Streptomyces tsukubensis]|uniref:hypothetical protein n=1 Tax=Streptomyces tsukubensis TaxID=83656 RepID=UPI00344F6E35